MMILGVDVSIWNTGPDWKLMYQNGVRFAVVKITQGNHITDGRALGHTAYAGSFYARDWIRTQ